MKPTYIQYTERLVCSKKLNTYDNNFNTCGFHAYLLIDSQNIQI